MIFKQTGFTPKILFITIKITEIIRTYQAALPWFEDRSSQIRPPTFNLWALGFQNVQKHTEKWCFFGHLGICLWTLLSLYGLIGNIIKNPCSKTWELMKYSGNICCSDHPNSLNRKSDFVIQGLRFKYFIFRIKLLRWSTWTSTHPKCCIESR